MEHASTNIKVAIASGKGGTGKTFISTNLFATLEQSGFVPVIVDCDAEVPNDHLFFKGTGQCIHTTKNLCPDLDSTACTFCRSCVEFCSYNAIVCIPSVHYIKLMDDLCHGCGACLHACKEGAIQEHFKVTGEVTAYSRHDDSHPFLYEAKLKEGEHSPVPVIKDAIKIAGTNPYDFMILDAPPGCSCPFVTTVSEADYVLLVTEPTPFGLSDLKHTVTVLRTVGKPFSVVINRSDLGNGEMKNWLTKEGIDVLLEFQYSEEIASIYASGDLVVNKSDNLIEQFKLLKDKLLHKIKIYYNINI